MAKVTPLYDIGGDITYEFSSAYKVFPQEGNLVYEYNPFFNYRLDHTMLYFRNRLWDLEDLCTELGIYCKTDNTTDSTENYELYFDEEYKDRITEWSQIIPATETPPIVYQAGQLVDFETDELSFSLNNPVNILPQYSYDNSVNLIINDGLNPPRLINSRWSATERNKYQVCDRKGDNDSNIYDQGEQFDVDTSLYKKITKIPVIKYQGVSYGGNLSVGNYHFYFRYVDDDKNMSDFFGESGLVSIFIGNTADSIYSGFRNENAHKLVKFSIGNIDPSYTKIIIYYTKSTSDINENAVVSAFRIDREWMVTANATTMLTITGYEEVDEVTLEEINPVYLIYGSAETQATALNMLFLANVDKPKTDYDDLSDCALRFLPYLDTSLNYNISQIGNDYSGPVKNTYYDPDFIYKYTGYHGDELYRFGIVFILKDNTLSEVYNVRGIKELPKDLSECSEYANNDYTLIDKKGDGYLYNCFGKYTNDNKPTLLNRTYINYDELYYNLPDSTAYLENAKGVVLIPQVELYNIVGIKFTVAKEVIEYLQDKYGILGFFFVRLKRIPTTLCQAYTIGIDKESHTPVLPIRNGESYTYYTESFIGRYQVKKKDEEDEDESRLLTHELGRRLRSLENYEVVTQAAICPEYDVNSPYLNSLFTASSFMCRNEGTYELTNNSISSNVHYIMNTNGEKANDLVSTKIIGVEDNVKLVAINDNLFAARAGEAEEAFRYEYIGKENKCNEADNLLRGSYGPYLGITGYDYPCNLISIKIPGYSESNMDDYFGIRYHDKSPYYAISDKFDLEKIKTWSEYDKIDDESEFLVLDNTLYRGDCYICQFTHRLNRNFQDPSSPTNDLIVDEKCWQENYEFEDGILKTENFDKINLGDVNAIKLGLYITVFVRSTFNLNIRALDESRPDEISMFGHNRGFYPYFSMSNAGSYKIPEALCYNKGFEKSLSERVNFEVPDVPWIKNEFSNRIAYSNIDVRDLFDNGWRTFEGGHYRDYSKEYGSITKLVELGGSLLCVFEHGVSLIPVNERAIAAEGSGGEAYINTSNVLPENPKPLSSTIGSQWRESVIKTDYGVFGVDTVAKKIWKTDGQTFNVISDFIVLSFLNDNITLSERELEPIIGIRNVKTHYYRNKYDVMFTFYDNLYGFEEKVWNLCYNIYLQKWVTFYSWVPSCSENSYQTYFSFDRNTSKWIAKLGVSHISNDFSDGVCLSENEIPYSEDPTGYLVTDDEGNITYKEELKEGEEGTPIYWEAKLSLENRTLPTGEGVKTIISYELERDNFLNYKKFTIFTKIDKDGNTKVDDDGNAVYYLVLTGLYTDLCSEMFLRTTRTLNNNGTYDYDSLPLEKGGTLIDNLDSGLDRWINCCIFGNSFENKYYYIYKKEGKRLNLDQPYNLDKIVTLLNIRANIKVSYLGEIPDLADAYATGDYDCTYTDAGYYESVVAVIPEWNKLFLTTDFWKHGLTGIIDIADKIYPTYWYGKQHPFEFEFVVAAELNTHKIFDNLEIISNNAEPESFHYEIIGDSYDFAKDKKNMYIRLEETKELYQYNGMDVIYDHDYSELVPELRELPGTTDHKLYDKSTILPLWYSRQDTINEIEDYYHLKDNINTKDFSALSGGEIVYYDTLDEYRIWSHSKAVPITEDGRLRGNMHYKEDKWYALIDPINIILKNETKWPDDGIPIELQQSPIPDDVKEKGEIDWPDDLGDPKKMITYWGDFESQNSQVKVKDKWIKIRIRYSGNKLAVISAVNTLYSISFA